MYNFFTAISDFFHNIAMFIWLSFKTIIKGGLYPLISLIALVSVVTSKQDKTHEQPTRKEFWFGIAGTLIGWYCWLFYAIPSVVILNNFSGASNSKIITIGILFAASAYIDIKRTIRSIRKKKTDGIVKE